MSTAASTSPSRTTDSHSHQRQPSTSRAIVMKNRIRIFGSSWSECGYCKGRRSSLAIRNDDDNDKNQASSEDSNTGSSINNSGSSSRAYTVLGTHCEPDVYEALIERGWRRSGRALYKPDNRRSCCPALTIRLPTCAFRTTKAQRKLQTQVRRRLSPSTSARTLVTRQHDHGDDDDDDASSRHPMSVEAMDPLESDETSFRNRLDPPSFAEGSSPSSGGALHRPPKKRGRRSSQGRSLGSETAAPTQQSALHSSIVPSAIDPTFVRKLQDATTTALQSVLHAAKTGIDDDATRVASDMLPLVPVQYKVVKSGSGPPHGARRVTLSTSVCAAMCGRLVAAASKARHASEANTNPADPSTPNRGELAQQLARDLEKRCVAIGATLAPAGTTTNAAVPHPACRVVSVEAHVPSGQVLVHVEVGEPSPAPTSNGSLPPVAAALTTAQSKPNGSPARLGPAVLTPSQNSQHDASDSVDRVDRWWRRSLALHDQQKLQPSGALASAALVRWAAMIRAGVSIPDPPYDMRVTTLPAHESALDPAVHQLYVEYQHAVHGDPDPFARIPLDAFVPEPATNSSSQTSDQNGMVDGPTEDKDMLDLSDGNEADGGDEGSLYRWAPNAPSGYKDQVETMLQSAYPRAMSRPRIRRQIVSSFDGFYEFLVENPFDSSNEANHGSRRADNGANPDNRAAMRLPPGTYHQHYRLGSVLVAVGVVDLLPGGLSSVYLFYDPVFTRDVIAMGKFAILKEIEFTRDVLRLPYYYLGYYIESCPKMRYKIEYKPSELLCPVTYRWVDAEQGKATLLRDSPQRHCCQLYYEEDGDTDRSRRNALSTDQAQPAVHESISLDVGAGFAVTLNQLQPRGRAFLEPILRTFVDEAGDCVAPRCTIAFR